MKMAHAEKFTEHVKKYPERVKEEITKITIIGALSVNTIYTSFINKSAFIKKSIYYIKWKEAFTVSVGKA